MATFFQNPLLLAALAAVLLPPIIEWLFRRRKRQVDLPTIRYLLNNQEEKKVRRQDRILLLVRMLAIGLIVFAVSRPLIRDGVMGESRQRNVVVLLDATASMHQQVDVTTAFGLAKRKAAGVLKALPEDAKVTAIVFGDQIETIVENVQDRFTAAANVEKLQAGSGALPASAALKSVSETLKRLKQENVELYVFSDFQKYTWAREGGEAAAVAKLLSELGSQSELFLVDVGAEPQFNLMVTVLEPTEYVLSAGIPVNFKTLVESTGEVPDSTVVDVAFLVDGKKQSNKKVTIGKDPVAAEFTFRFPRSGEYLVEVEINGDEHLIDNRRLFICKVPEDSQVLVIDDLAENGSGGQSAYLARAIRPPGHPGLEKFSHFRPKVISPDRIAYENLSNYSVVVLAATGNLNEAMVGQIEAYVSDGGAAWFFLGDSVNIYDYNRFLFKDGKGLLPYKIDKKVVADGNGQEVPYLVYGDSNHPAMSEFSGLAGSKAGGFRQYMELDTNSNTPGSSRSVATLSNGQPAIVEREFGRGRVLLTNTSAGLDWTYLPALREYVVLVQEVLRYLVGKPDADVNLNVGQPFDQPVFVSTQQLLLRYPDRRTTARLKPSPVGENSELFHVRFSDTTQQGLYEIEAIEEALGRRRFVVNQSGDEGNLARLTKSDVKDAFNVSGSSWIGQETRIEEFAENLHTVIELAKWFLWTLVLILIVESFLAWRYGRRRGESVE